ncbi:protein PAT1 homolog [Phragmites australis]|uniref:protein PAT1 homolog n=1 Tax=Phragmites australis TaxID=29695 RepID=UPI002D7978F0|nr:protein PAT1 homolog [Phragmites australis]
MAAPDEGGGGGMESSGLCDTRFDASQYAFFGNNVTEEIELGGLEDDSDRNAAFVGLNDVEHTPSSQENALEAEDIGSFSDVDDLANTFSKLGRYVNKPKHIGIKNRGVSFSRESSTAADWAPEFESPCCPDQYVQGAKQEQDGNGWWSQQHHSSHFVDSRLHRTSSSPQQQEQHNPNEPVLGPRPSPLHRTSSYPQKEHQYNPIETIPAPKSPNISHPPPGGQPHQMNMPPFNEFQMHMSARNEAPFSQFPLGGTPPESLFGGNLGHMVSTGFSNNNSGQQNLLLNNGQFPGELARIMPNLVQNHMQCPNGFVPPQMLPVLQQHGRLPIQQSPQHLPRMQAQMFGPQHPPRMMNKFDNFGMPESSDPRIRSSMHHGRQGYRVPLQGSEFSVMRMDNGRPRFRSKYMSTEELENISRIQHAATHINDPYIDDYYHQACLVRRSVDARLKHFCPTLIRDPSSCARSKDEPHAYLKVDALGRLPFSSIRRPRPLLDVELASTTDDNTLERSVSKPLDQEPMLAARITIEDGLCVLLDIDDIDRLLQFNQQQDGGLQLRNRRQSLLRQLEESLQLADPLGPNKTAHLSPNDDLVFLRIVFLPKGRKLLSRYLNLMVPGSDLSRIACMAVFRHLRFVFGNLPSDNGSAETVTKLASAVAACIRGMDLSGLSACLAAIVCSSEHPPLRPLGYAAGDGATVIIKSVLDRATELLTEQLAASNYSVPNRALWQASFNAFFGLVTKYCVSKFDSLVHTMHKHPAAATVISRELPIELLRASLPHTDEQQRRLLLEFAQRTVPVTGHSSHGAAGGPMTSESVPSYGGQQT